MKIDQVQKKLKERLAMGINYGLQSLEEVILPKSTLHNEVIQVKSQYNDLNRIASQGILGYEQIEIGYNKMRMSILNIVDRIENKDIGQEETRMPRLQNNEVQHRKQNFFELLKIHFDNLEKVQVLLSSSERDDLKTGRDAIGFIYDEIFTYRFTSPRYSEGLENIEDFSNDFFIKRYPRLEVYMKTLGFILRYVLQDEMEQTFYLDMLKSVLSRRELLMIAYYAIGKIETDYQDLLNDSGLIQEVEKENLIDPAHWSLLVDNLSEKK